MIQLKKNILNLIFLSSFFTNLTATVYFKNDTATIAIKESNSKLKINNASKVTGWSESSIVKDFGNESCDQWVEGYSSGVIITQDGSGTVDAQTNLVYSNSNALVYGIKNNSNALIIPAKDFENNSNALLYGIKNNSNALVNIDQDIENNSNTLLYGIKNNSNALVKIDQDIENNSNTLLYGIKNNSNALIKIDQDNGIQNNSNALLYGIKNNSNALLPLIEDMKNNSNALLYGIKNNSNALLPLIEDMKNNSNALLYGIKNNSNALVKIDQDIENNSNALLYGIKNNSNALIKIDQDNGIQNNSNALLYGIKNNSNALLLLIEDMKNNSNALLYGIKNNSNALIKLNKDMENNSNALLYGIKNNSNTLVENFAVDIKNNSNTLLYIADFFKYNREHKVFHSGDTVQTGFVRFNNGFTVEQDATAVLDTYFTVSGGIDLRNTGKIKLLSTLYLDSNVTLTPGGGQINAMGNSVILEGNLHLPDNYILYIVGDLAIDGNGNELSVGRWAQLVIDQSTTLTLRNLTLRSTYTEYPATPVRLSAPDSQLALENVNLKIANDFDFDRGQLFIHNDVVVSGTYNFNYRSPSFTRICSDSSLAFESGMTFEYRPSSTIDNLIEFEDKSASLYLNGCVLQTTHTGLRLTAGNLFLDNRVTLSSAGYTRLDAMDDIFTINTAISSNPRSVAWSPDGVYLAVVGDSVLLEIYRFNGSQFQFIASVNHGASSVNRVAWHPSGKYLAIGSNKAGEPVHVYRFDRETNALSSAGTYNAGGTVYGLSWSPDGNYLAVGIFGSPAKVIVLGFNGNALSFVTQDSWFNNSKTASSIEWSPDGLYLLAGGNDDTLRQIILYSFNGVALTRKSLIKSVATIVRDCKWSSDQNYVSVVSGNSDGNVSIYPFYRGTGTLGGSVGTATLPGHGGRSTTWSKDRNYVFVGLDTSPADIIVYIFDGTSLTEATNLTGGLSSTFVWSLAISPDGKNLAASFTASNLNVKNYRLIYGYDTTSQAYSKSIVFGESVLGADDDLEINLLGRSYVDLAGQVFYDNVN